MRDLISTFTNDESGVSDHTRANVSGTHMDLELALVSVLIHCSTSSLSSVSPNITHNISISSRWHILICEEEEGGKGEDVTVVAYWKIMSSGL